MEMAHRCMSLFLTGSYSSWSWDVSLPAQSKRVTIHSPVCDRFQLHKVGAQRHNKTEKMSTFIAKVFVLAIAISYAVLLIALIIWIARRKNNRGKSRGHG